MTTVLNEVGIWLGVEEYSKAICLLLFSVGRVGCCAATASDEVPGEGGNSTLGWGIEDGCGAPALEGEA